ncbi:TonB-dependent receptor [Paracandidimonas lactea]|uniref:TonB-dependent receptor n=1 Tax=Paracandidimonas lactea TaxID=2895524 RepID=UPI001EFFA53E
MAFASLYLPAAVAQVPAAPEISRLPGVTVHGDAQAMPAALPGGLAASGGTAGMLGTQDVMDVPFNLVSYTSRFIESTQATTVAEVLAYDASVAISQTSGMVDSLSIRGFPIGEGNVGETAFNGVFGIAPNYRILTPYVERIEVLKGATGMLYGMLPDSGVGGVINIVPKRAATESLTRLSTNYSSESMGGVELDIGRRFGADGQVGVRLNSSHQAGATGVDNQQRKTSVGALGLDYQGERLSATLDTIWQRDHWKAPSRVYSVAPGVQVPDAPDGSANPTQKWGWSTLEDRSVLLGLKYRVGEQSSLFANLGRGFSEVDRIFDQQMVLSNERGDFSTTPRSAVFQVTRETANAGIRTRFATGRIDHAVTVEASTLEIENGFGMRNGTSLRSNLYAPVQYPDQYLQGPNSVLRVALTRLRGLAVSDTLSLFDDRIRIITGLRHQHISSRSWSTGTGALASRYRESAVTPSVGLIVRPTSTTMVYASYIEGLNKGDVAPLSVSNAGETFAPYTSRQHEVGVKFEGEHFNAGVSAFQIIRPAGEIDGGVFGVTAEQRNRGLEFSLQGEPANGLRALISLMLLDARLTHTSRLGVAGNRPIGAPNRRASAALEWDTPWLAGLTLIGGVVYTGSQYANQQNTALLPAWTRVDLGARYRTRVSGTPVTLQGTLHNTFNNGYWSGVSQWGAFSLSSPRSLMVTASAEF